MRIVLNELLEVLPLNESKVNFASDRTLAKIRSNAIKTAKINLKKQSLKCVRPVKNSSLLCQHGLLNTISTAYDRHYDIIINPHDLWYIVLTQIADEVCKNPKKYKGLFTSADNKQKIIVVQDDPTNIDVIALVDQLKSYIPGGQDKVELFLPELTTLTPSSRLAMAAAFCTTVREYFDYGIFCCGLPAIQLKGSKYDWHLLSGNCLDLCDVFQDSKILVDYLIRAHILFKNIASTYAKINIDFWKNIYRQNNVGSGDDLIINGWITELYLNNDGGVLKNFHDCMSSFQYENISTKQKFVMVHGAFNANMINDSTIEAGYDYATFEILDQA